MTNPAAETPRPPVRNVFAVKLLGLPLSRHDNLVCFMVIVLAVFLQIRLQHTFLGEGWFALLGFIAYVALRLWLLNRRYPEPGEIILEADRISLPGSLNAGKPELILFSDLKAVTTRFFKTKGGGQNLTSLEFDTGFRSYCVNWLAADLNILERELIKRGVRVTRVAGTYEQVISFGLLVFILLLLLVFSTHFLR
ncbi:MAG TPA: hypothetical protein PKN29_05905 [Candidatus Ozemobacteraceae bacterium]|nr:hypothetical protein [Candidatus Ozemobacteraceae bacterium]